MDQVARRTFLGAAGLAFGGLNLAQDASARSMPSAPKNSSTYLKIWQDFCQELSGIGQILERPSVPRNGLDQAEGIRYLTRLMRTALEMAMESADPDFPRFFQMSNETIKIGADNPDNIYLNSVVAGDRSYRITGTRGTVPYLSFGTKANRYSINGEMATTGELDAKDLVLNADGSFELIVSRERTGKNWLPLAADSTMLLVRQTFLDKQTETPAQLSIEAIGGPAVPQPLSEDQLVRALRTATGFVAGTAKTFAEWTEMFMTKPNQLLPWDQSFFQRGGGDPNIHYLHGYWELKPDQAWILRTPVPKSRFWNFQVDNWWMESLDYRTRPNVWTNPKKAKLEKDGSLILVVSPRDLGFGTWIDTAGHSNGTALLRWINADAHPVPMTEILSI